MAYIETKTTRFGKCVGGSLKRIGKGILLFIAGICMIVVMSAWLAACGQSGRKAKGDREVVYHYWLANVEGAWKMEVVFAQYGSVFRGEFVAPPLYDYGSIPIFGTIDDEGNVNGVSASVPSNGGLYGQLRGKITAETFHFVWLPSPEHGGEFWEVDLKKEPLTPEAAAQVHEHPDAFCNILFPEQVNTNSMGERVDRIVPIMPKNVRTITQVYGYRIGEWESKYIELQPGKKDDEVLFHLRLSQEGRLSLAADIRGSARWNGNRFCYKENDYEFEVAVYNGFVVIQTIAGSIAFDRTNEDDDDVVFTADGVYPTPLERNCYANGASEEIVEEERSVEDEMFASIFALPEVKSIGKAAAMVVDSPSVTKPYYTVKVGSNLEDHFVTSYWFYVYTTPKLEIRVYDLVTDAEMTLQEWRRAYGEDTSPPGLITAYIKCDSKHPAGGVSLLVDDVLWIDGDDTETLNKYGIRPEEVSNDYALYNESEGWKPFTTTSSTTFQILSINPDDGNIIRQTIEPDTFCKHLEERGNDGILAKVSVAGENILSVEEIYTP